MEEVHGGNARVSFNHGQLGVHARDLCVNAKSVVGHWDTSPGEPASYWGWSKRPGIYSSWFQGRPTRDATLTDGLEVERPVQEEEE